MKQQDSDKKLCITAARYPVGDTTDITQKPDAFDGAF